MTCVSIIIFRADIPSSESKTIPRLTQRKESYHHEETLNCSPLQHSALNLNLCTGDGRNPATRHLYGHSHSNRRGLISSIQHCGRCRCWCRRSHRFTVSRFDRGHRCTENNTSLCSDGRCQSSACTTLHHDYYIT